MIEQEVNWRVSLMNYSLSVMGLNMRPIIKQLIHEGPATNAAALEWICGFYFFHPSVNRL